MIFRTSSNAFTRPTHRALVRTADAAWGSPSDDGSRKHTAETSASKAKLPKVPPFRFDYRSRVRSPLNTSCGYLQTSLLRTTVVRLVRIASESMFLSNLESVDYRYIGMNPWI